MTYDRDLIERVRKLKGFGWATKMGRNNLTGAWSVSLHRRFKNGNAHKGHDVALQYSPRNGRKEPSARPYRVESPRFDRAKSYKYFRHARERFLVEAKACAPEAL